MLKKILLLTLAIALLATGFVFADESQSTLSKVTGLTDQEIQTYYQARVGYGRILTASIVAKITGTDIKDIISANQEGSTFAQIAEDKGVELEEYKDAVLEGKSAYIDEQVNAGALTEAQAEVVKERMQQRIENCDGTAQYRSQGQGMGMMQGAGQGFRGQGMNGAGRGFRGNGAGMGNSQNSIFNQ